MFTQAANMLENELIPPCFSIPTVSVSTLWIGEQTVGLIRGKGTTVQMCDYKG